MIGIGGHDLHSLNDEMKAKDANAIIMIDALNEGATESFWNAALNWMKNILDECKQIKLIITYRNGENFGLPMSSHNENLTGFEDKIVEAIDKYFKHYQIIDHDGKLRQKFQEEFKEPLFLYMFSIVVSNDINYTLDNFTYSGLFHQYIKYRNEKISKGVDEDFHRNITEMALMKLANYSLYYKGCGDVPRQKPVGTLTKFVETGYGLKSSVLVDKENLLLATGNEGETLMFGYQKMGDFLMADVLLRTKCQKVIKLSLF